MKEKRTLMDIVWRVVLYAWSLTIIFPLIWVIYESLKSNPEFLKIYGRCLRNSDGRIIRRLGINTVLGNHS